MAANKPYLGIAEILDPNLGTTPINEMRLGTQLIWSRYQLFTLSASDATNLNVKSYLTAKAALLTKDIIIYLPAGITANKITKGDISAYTKVTLVADGLVHGAGGVAGAAGGDAIDTSTVGGTLYIENNGHIYGGCGGGGTGGAGGAGNDTPSYGALQFSALTPLSSFTYNASSAWNGVVVLFGNTGSSWFISGGLRYRPGAEAAGFPTYYYIQRGSVYTGAAGAGGAGGRGDGYLQTQTAGIAGTAGTYRAGNGGTGGAGGLWAGTQAGVVGATGASGIKETAPYTATTPAGTAGTAGGAAGKAILGTNYSITNNGTVIGVMD